MKRRICDNSQISLRGSHLLYKVVVIYEHSASLLYMYVIISLCGRHVLYKVVVIYEQSASLLYMYVILSLCSRPLLYKVGGDD